jgi:hypothetical protein
MIASSAITSSDDIELGDITNQSHLFTTFTDSEIGSVIDITLPLPPGLNMEPSTTASEAATGTDSAMEEDRKEEAV